MWPVMVHTGDEDAIVVRGNCCQCPYSWRKALNK